MAIIDVEIHSIEQDIEMTSKDDNINIIITQPRPAQED